MVNLTPADICDSAGARAILDAIRKRNPWLKHLFADGAFDRTRLMDKAAFFGYVVELVRRMLPFGFVPQTNGPFDELVTGFSCRRCGIELAELQAI